MKKIILLIVIGALSLPQSYAQTEEDEEMMKEMIDNYVYHLKSEGYKPEVDKDGDIEFKKEGRTYFIELYDEDFFIISTWLQLDEDQDCSKDMMSLLNDFHFSRANERAFLYKDEGICDLIEIQSSSHLVRSLDWEKLLDTKIIWLTNSVDTFWDLYSEL